MNKANQKVVPFTGYLHPVQQQVQQPQQHEQQKNIGSTYFIFSACLLVSGLCLGAMGVYQSPDQVKLRDLQQQASQLQQVKSNVCK